MTQLNRSSVNRYVEAYSEGLRDREARSLAENNRSESARQHVARWFGATWIRREADGYTIGSNRADGGRSESGLASVVSAMLPISARWKRKPWVVSQLPV